MLDIQWIIVFLALGAVVGFMAGLLGIGGGGIMVPALTSIFLAMGVTSEQVVHLALGTSLASIVTTSFASLRAHHQNQGVIWHIVQKMSLGIILGTFLATFFAAHLNSLALAIFFASYMAVVAVQIILDKKPKPSRKTVGKFGLFSTGVGIGIVSALVSIGGGTMTVPFLLWQNINMRQAIGTSAAIGFPIAIAGTIGYIINGWDSHILGNYSFGFIYLPAVFLISIVSFFTAPLGAKLAHSLAIPVLKKLFAILLVILSVKMLFMVMI